MHLALDHYKIKDDVKKENDVGVWGGKEEMGGVREEDVKMR